MFQKLVILVIIIHFGEQTNHNFSKPVNTIRPLLEFINRDIPFKKLLEETTILASKGNWIGHVLKSCLSYAGIGELENIFVALIHQSISQDLISMMALNYRHMMGYNTHESKLIATNGFYEIYQLLKENLTMFDYADLSTLVFHEKKDFKNVKSVLFPSSSISTLIVDLEENFSHGKAVKLLNEIIYSDYNGFYKQHLYSIIEILYMRGYSKHAQLFSYLMELKYNPLNYWLKNKMKLSSIRDFSLGLAIEGDVVASTIYAVTSYYLEDSNSTIMDAAYDYLLYAYNSKYKFSYHYMGLFFVEGIGFLKSNNEKGLHVLKEAASKGSLNSLLYLAEMNNAGIGIFSDSESAAELYHLALLHLIGKPFKISSFEAIYNKQYTKALLNMLILHQMGDEKQGYNIATLFRSGFINDISIDKQKRLNFRFLKRAADIGLKDSWVKLADCYYYGYGVKQNFSDALLAYTNAFSNKDYVGAYSLGYMYQYGYGVDKDNEMAKYYYQKSVSYEPGAEVPIYFLSWRTRLDTAIMGIYQELKIFTYMNLTTKINILCDALLYKISFIDIVIIFYTLFTVVTTCVVWKCRIKF